MWAGSRGRPARGPEIGGATSCGHIIRWPPFAKGCHFHRVSQLYLSFYTFLKCLEVDRYCELQPLYQNFNTSLFLTIETLNDMKFVVFSFLILYLCIGAFRQLEEKNMYVYMKGLFIGYHRKDPDTLFYKFWIMRTRSKCISFFLFVSCIPFHILQIRAFTFFSTFPMDTSKYFSLFSFLNI